MTLSGLSNLDIFVFAFILLLTLGAVLYGQWRKQKQASQEAEWLDHLLMGRALSLPLFLATLVATWYGGIFGVTQMAFEQGIYMFLTQGLFWYATYILFALFLVKRIRESEAVTLPHLVEKLFGPRSARAAAVLNFLNVVPIAYALSLGLFLQVLFGGSLSLWTLAGVAFVLMYSLLGGFRAVVFSDVIQFAVMCSSVFLIAFFAVQSFGGLDFLFSQLPASHFELSGGVSLWTTLVWGFVALSTLVDPNFYHRCFAAHSTKTAQKGILFSTLIWMAFDLCTLTGALYARAVLPEAASNQAYLEFALTVLPAGLKGFALAGILATILSTLDSYIFMAGTTLTYDLFPHRYRQQRWIHAIGVMAVGLIAFALSLVFDGNIREIWKTLGSFSAACLLLPMLTGFLLPGRLSDKSFFMAVTLSFGTSLLWRVGPKPEWAENIEMFYVGLVTSLLVIAFELYRTKNFQSPSRP